MEQKTNNYLNIALKSKGLKRLIGRRTRRYGLAFLLSVVSLAASVFYGLQEPIYFVLSGVAGLLSLFFLVCFFSSMKKPKYANAGWVEDVHFRVHKIKKKEEKRKYHYEYAVKDGDKIIWARCIDSKDSLNEQTKTPGEEVIFFLYGKDEWFCISYFGKINNVDEPATPTPPVAEQPAEVIQA